MRRPEERDDAELSIDSAQPQMRLHFLKAEKRTETIHRLHDLACQRADEFASASTGCFNVTIEHVPMQ